MSFNLYDYLLMIGMIFGVVYLFYTHFSAYGKLREVVYLKFFVLFLTLHNFQIVFFGNQPDNNILERKLLISWYVMIIPMFYGFVSHYLKLSKKQSYYANVGVVLFAIETLVRLFLIPNYFYDIQNLSIAKYAQIEEIINALYTLLLFSKVCYLFLRQSKSYQYMLTLDSLQWIKQFLWLGFFILVTWVFAIVYNLNNALNPVLWVYYPLRISASGLLYWISFQGFFNSRVITEREVLKVFVADKMLQTNADFQKKIPQRPTKNLDFEILEKHIISKKCYLDPNLSIEDLAKQLRFSPKKINDLLEKHTNFGFVDYINHFRVETAKKILLDKKYIDYTIISIAIESGFYSKSTFYRAFDKFIKMTPTQYRKENGY